MGSLSFFDCLKSQSSILNIAEEYLYLPVISKAFGFRKFEMFLQDKNKISLNEKSNKYTSFHSKCVRAIAALIQLISYTTLVLPAIACLSKIYHRNCYQFQIGGSQSLSEKKAAELEIQQLWDDYKIQLQKEDYNLMIALESMSSEVADKNKKTSNISPDTQLGNILLSFEKDPDVFYVPVKDSPNADLVIIKKIFIIGIQSRKKTCDYAIVQR